jgi:transposase-like protein
MDLMDLFGTDEKCRIALERLRWPDGVRCSRCNGAKHTTMSTRSQYDCLACGYQFSVTSGTIFHDTHLPLRKWFMAIYLIVESKKGISANQVKRILGLGSYKTAWYLCHRIRAAMTEHDPALLNGTVECDETYIGGKLHGQGTGIGNYISNKAVVIGIIQRGGKVRLQVIDKCDRKTLHGFIKKHAAPDTEVIITDQLPAYKGIADHDTAHETVNHMKKEWVRGNIHTNSIENVWSLLKRSVTGTYHKLSVKHMDAYLDELEWRFNNRENPFLFRDTLLKLIGSKNLEYQELIAS